MVFAESRVCIIQPMMDMMDSFSKGFPGHGVEVDAVVCVSPAKPKQPPCVPSLPL